MLASLLARYHRPHDQETARFEGWTTALAQLRLDLATGAFPSIADLARYAAPLPDQQRRHALEDFVAEHLRASWQSGRGVRLDAYLCVLNDGDWRQTVPARLIEDELLARYQLPHGDQPPLGEYLQRFANRDDVLALLARRFVHHERYVKLRQLGVGAMGEVWEVFDRHLLRLVALKEPRPACRDSESALRRFAEEARITAGLEHPGIACVHEYHASSQDAPCYVMRLVTGRTLGERIRDLHAPPLDRTTAGARLLRHELLRALLSTAEATAFAHAHGVVHCDLKPGNVVLGEFGDAVILDWGMARRIAQDQAPAADGRNSADLVAGTPDYMAPEQADGIADARSDVFGLGAILYELLTGRSPHGWPEGSRPHDWRELVREARFERPRRIDPSAPRSLEAICLHAIHREPAQRYQTARDLVLDLQRYLAGEPVSAWQEPLHARMLRLLRRSW